MRYSYVIDMRWLNTVAERRLNQFKHHFMIFIYLWSTLHVSEDWNRLHSQNLVGPLLVIIGTYVKWWCLLASVRCSVLLLTAQCDVRAQTPLVFSIRVDLLKRRSAVPRYPRPHDPNFRSDVTEHRPLCGSCHAPAPPTHSALGYCTR